MATSFLKNVKDEKAYAIEADSATSLIFMDPGFGEYFKWMNQLYNEGLIDPEYYVDTTENALKKTL